MYRMNCCKFIILIALLLVTSLTWARGTAGVKNGVHNLSASGVDPWVGTPGSSLYATDEDEICVFCHTPHGGSLTGALWNRSNPTSAWSHYNSATMSIDSGLAVGRAPNDESLLCLSCHDGSISVNHIINQPNDRSTPIETWNGDQGTKIIDDIITGGPGKRIGGSFADSDGTGDLSDDHPISFSYTQVLGSSDYDIAGPKYDQLKDVTAAEAGGNGVRFFGGAAKNVECSSCHDPHVDYLEHSEYTPFLIMSNSGSALCLACHTK
jgi:hypothetical protein